jgi:DNA polymerase III alpha subunit
MIKGLGDSLVGKVLKEREKGIFKTISEFCSRMNGKGFGKNKTESLIFSGCFDECYGIKNILKRKKIYDEFLGYSNKESKFTDYQMSESSFWIEQQKELTGYGDIDFKNLVFLKDSKSSQFFIYAEEINQIRKNQTITIAGYVDFIRKINGKKGQFCKFRLRCNNGYIDGVLWSESWDKYKEDLETALSEKRKICLTRGICNFDDYSKQNQFYSDSKQTKLIFL